MLDFMDYVVRAFERSTSWNRDNNYENINATSDTLINFSIPNTFKFQTSDRSSKHTFNTLEVTANKKISGSLAYLYTDANNMDKYLEGSNLRTLQDSTETYRHIQPFFVKQSKEELADSTAWHKNGAGYRTKSLYYGRIYYPTSILESLIIKKINPYNQLTIKSLSSVNSRLNIILVNWQRSKNENLQELTFSSDGALCGYRFLHNFISSPSRFNNALYNNSSLSMGGEVWLGLLTLTPSCSTSLRYCTHAANTGRPLTLTFSWNPLFGHISSTYSAKTSTNTTFSARYDFNLYSTDSNLSFGCEFWTRNSYLQNNPITSNNVPTTIDNNGKSSIFDTEKIEHDNIKDNTIPDQQQKLLDDLTYTFSSSLQQIDKEKSIIENFENKFGTENFTNVWKVATSLRDQNVRILWEGKFKGFLISAGTEIFLTRDYLNSLVQVLDDRKSSSTTGIAQPQKYNSAVSLGLTIQYCA